MVFFLFFLQIPFGNVTENEEALAGLREKFEKRQAKEEKKKKAQEKKAAKKEKQQAKRRKTVREEPEEEDSDPNDVQMVLDDSSEYSDEIADDDDLTAEHYPFAEKAPEVSIFTFLLTNSFIRHFICCKLPRLLCFIFILQSFFFFHLSGGGLRSCRAAV